MVSNLFSPALWRQILVSPGDSWRNFWYRHQVFESKSKTQRQKLQEAYEQQAIAKAKRLTTPETLIFYVNMRCNAKCAHCFIWKILNTGIYEMQLDQIEKIVDSLDNPVMITFTGGEPFLRQNLFDIAKVFVDHRKLKSATIVTNGSFPGLIQKFADRWLAETDQQLTIQISVDGLREMHDAIRRIPHGFDKILETIEILKRYPQDRIGFETSSTLHKKNKDHVFRLIKFFRKRQTPYKFTIMRGNSYSTFGLPRRLMSHWDPMAQMIALTPEEIIELARKVDRQFPGYLAPAARAKLILTARTMEKKRRLIPCFAGTVEAVIHANGDVSHCEQTKPFGNLQETRFNFRKLWQSRKANEQRPYIQKCSCIHGCNLSTSIMRTQRDLYYARPLD